MKNKEDINNSAFYYSVNMLRHLLKMNLIKEDEYNRIVRISSEYYSTKIYCVKIFKSAQFRWKYVNSCGIVGVAPKIR